MDGNNLEFSNKINILGFSLGRTGFRGHIGSKIATTRGRNAKLKRIRNLGSKTKCHLYKSLVRSALEYPNIPMCKMTKENKDKLVKFQNGVIIEPFNTHMYRRAVKTWERFKEIG